MTVVPTATTVNNGSSNQNVTVAQLLREVVEYIRNRKQNRKGGLRFSFCYNTTDVIDSGTSKGEKNRARAEIDYYDSYNGSWHAAANDTVNPVNTRKTYLAPNRGA